MYCFGQVLDMDFDTSKLLAIDKLKPEADTCRGNFEAEKNAGDVCPHHWVPVGRENRFPFNVPIAVCDCAKCQDFSAFASTKSITSKAVCTSKFTLKPVVYREDMLASQNYDDEEFWMFGLEQVPTSCSCTVKVQIYWKLLYKKIQLKNCPIIRR